VINFRNFWLSTLVRMLFWYFGIIIDYAALHPARAMLRVALDETIYYIRENMPLAIAFPSSYQILKFALQRVELEGHYLEFGVWYGGSIKFIARQIRGKDIHGFDSFKGLPEDWSGHYYTKDSFNMDGKPPRVPGNVHLHPGWFSQALPRWLETHPGPVAFIHIDCDLYTSTKDVFEQLVSRIQPGTVIVFDEYFNYPNWRHHEFKAFQEFVKEYNVTYDYMAYARQQVAVIIKFVDLK
jgi:hypothetical protein